MAEAHTLWGIDLGGTKIEGVVLPGPTSTQPIRRLRIPTEAHLGYRHIVERVGHLLDLLEEATGAACPRLGIGTPGSVDPATGKMKNCNTTCLNGQPLPADLAAMVRRDVAVANDANCFALAETRLGAGRGSGCVFGVIMGTGVGGGLVIDGKVLTGAQGIAGEWGHNVLEPNGYPCYCGKRGCVETVLSGTGLQRYYAGLTGVDKKLPEIVSAAREGEPEARETMQRLVAKFGEGLSVVVNIVDPDVIVLGGGVGNIDELYRDGVEALKAWTFNLTPHVQVVRPLLGDSAGVFGAAHLTAR